MQDAGDARRGTVDGRQPAARVPVIQVREEAKANCLLPDCVPTGRRRERPPDLQPISVESALNTELPGIGINRIEEFRTMNCLALTAAVDPNFGIGIIAEKCLAVGK